MFKNLALALVLSISTTWPAFAEPVPEPTVDQLASIVRELEIRNQKLEAAYREQYQLIVQLLQTIEALQEENAVQNTVISELKQASANKAFDK